MIHFKKLLQSPVYVVATFVFVLLLTGITFYLWNSPKKFSQQPQKLTSEILKEKLRQAFIKNKKQRDPAGKFNSQALRQSLQKLLPKNEDMYSIGRFVEKVDPELFKEGISNNLMEHLIDLSKKTNFNMDYIAEISSYKYDASVSIKGWKSNITGRELGVIIAFIVEKFNTHELVLNPIGEVYDRIYDLYREGIVNINKIRNLSRAILKPLSKIEIHSADVAALHYSVFHKDFAGQLVFPSSVVITHRSYKKLYDFFEDTLIGDSDIRSVMRSPYFGFGLNERALNILHLLPIFDDSFRFRTMMDVPYIYFWRNLTNGTITVSVDEYDVLAVSNYLDYTLGKAIKTYYGRASNPDDVLNIDHPFFQNLLSVAEESEEMAEAVYELFRQNIPGFE